MLGTTTITQSTTRTEVAEVDHDFVGEGRGGYEKGKDKGVAKHASITPWLMIS